MNIYWVILCTWHCVRCLWIFFCPLSLSSRHRTHKQTHRFVFFFFRDVSYFPWIFCFCAYFWVQRRNLICVYWMNDKWEGRVPENDYANSVHNQAPTMCPSFIVYKVMWERFIREGRQAPARHPPCPESLLAPGHILSPSVAPIPTASLSYRALCLWGEMSVAFERALSSYGDDCPI